MAGIRLLEASRAWGTQNFDTALKRDIEELDPTLLPLQQGLSVGSYVTDGKVTAMIINSSDAPGIIRAKAGIFYKAILGGCSCADDPTPVEEEHEYCEVQFTIDKRTGEASVELSGS